MSRRSRQSGRSAKEVCLWGLVLGLGMWPAAAWEWQESEGWRSAALQVPQGGRTGFTLLNPVETGLRFTNLLAMSRHLTNQILLNGSGVALGDVDGDGWCDVYLCALDNPNRLYRNRGQWRFEDVTDRANVALPNLTASGTAFADVDGDGDLDLIVNSVGQGTHILFNQAQGQFRAVTHPLGINPGKGGTSLALGDLDGDGYLELYVANYRTSALMDAPYTHFSLGTVQGRRVITHVNGRPLTEPDLADRYVLTERGGVEELGEVDVLYRNVGGTNFTRVSFLDGSFLDEEGHPLTALPFEWGLTVTMRDLNADGLPDIYVCNDFDAPDRLWINQGGLRLQAIPRLAIRKTGFFSMGADFSDINRDGLEDIFILDMRSRDHANRMDMLDDRTAPALGEAEIQRRASYMMNTLLLNRGDGTFAEIGQLSGVEATEWSWCPVFLDVDLDGYEDLLVANGNERMGRSLDMAKKMRQMRLDQKLSAAEVLQARKLYPRHDTPNIAFRNRGDLTFEEVGRAWGFDLKSVSHGMALADLDNDGDLDVIVNNLNDPVAVYRNDTSAPRLAVRLRGLPPNTHGIGATIRVTGGPVPQSDQVTCGGRYLSADDPLKVFAAGSLTNRLTVEVLWRSGRRSEITNAKPNHLYEIIETPSLPSIQFPPPGSFPVEKTPAFEDASRELAHQHQDEPFDDWSRQPLLPNRLSRLGPGVSWIDLDRDGREDLVVASGKGGRMGVFQNRGDGTFQKVQSASFDRPITRDQTTVLGCPDASGRILLLAGSANHEDGLEIGSSVRVFDPEPGQTSDAFPGRLSSTGPLALADLDGDDDLDLFVGGRCLPGQYPEPASSALFRNRNGRWEPDSTNAPLLQKVGLVSGAVFSDLDADGDPDLVLACEWGSLLLFENVQGQLQDRTRERGLDQFKGWWNGVATGDLDGDGRVDIVASNWGRNTPYQAYRHHPIRLYFGDFDANGMYDVVEGYFEPAFRKWVPVRGLDFLAVGLPALRERFQSYQAFGRASVEDILGEAHARAAVAEVTCLESMLFLNRGRRFEAQPLPVEAQFAPAFGLVIQDLDGDGAEDLFLAQNFFAAHPETPRYDAGCGLWLRGDGRGQFTAVSPLQSGLRVHGEQRGCAAADYDADGRVDLVVTQNGAATRLFRNRLASPGLRLRLAGPPSNPWAIGATLRLVDGGRSGPSREIQAGSGYWSQNGATQVMNLPPAPKLICVRWPGGQTNTYPLPPGARQVLLAPDGSVKASP